jgi:hypothetical protein
MDFKIDFFFSLVIRNWGKAVTLVCPAPHIHLNHRISSAPGQGFAKIMRDIS